MVEVGTPMCYHAVVTPDKTPKLLAKRQPVGRQVLADPQKQSALSLITLFIHSFF